jgi:hypothetical protein
MLWSLTISVTMAQPTDAMRVEISSRSLNKSHHVEILGNDGLMLFFESNELSDQADTTIFFGRFALSCKSKMRLN